MAAPGASSRSKYKSGLHHLLWSNMSRLAPREGHETPAQRVQLRRLRISITSGAFCCSRSSLRMPTYLPSIFQISPIVPFFRISLEEQSPK